MNPISPLNPAPLVQTIHAPMPGFDAEFQNLDHYIRVITDRIWEGGRIDDIWKYYSDPCVVETPSSVSRALQAVVDGTRATLAMFPDRRLLAEDVIQSGDAQTGFLSSHRIISTMTHKGDGAFGKATGKTIQVRTIADCLCKDNRIIHEWLVRDQSAIALQIGTTPKALAAQWLAAKGGKHIKPIAGAVPQGYVSHISDRVLAVNYAQQLESLVRGRGNEQHIYDDAVHHIGPGEQTTYGPTAVAHTWRERFAALIVQSFTVEHLTFNTDSERSARAAIRWRAQTVHANEGLFGEASGAAVEVMGINHVEFFRGRVLREWALIDDVAIWMQILAHQND
jgi:predicted ester cyclase